jgi:predicted O-methyltransferase YrrM
VANDFIQSLGLSVRTTDLQHFQEGQYDVVFVNSYDANSQQRFDLITKLAPNLVRQGGIIILNDGHFVNVRRAMDEMTSMGWKTQVPDQTMDRYERFWMVLKH